MPINSAHAIKEDSILYSYSATLIHLIMYCNDRPLSYSLTGYIADWPPERDITQAAGW